MSDNVETIQKNTTKQFNPYIFGVGGSMVSILYQLFTGADIGKVSVVFDAFIKGLFVATILGLIISSMLHARKN